ncbi:MAG: YceI family protein [Planctomycetota bacterium]
MKKLTKQAGLGVVVGLVVLVAGSRGSAAEISFDFRDPKRVNNVTFVLDSDLEPIMGVASGIQGAVQFDPKKPQATTGKIEIEAKAVHVSNSRMLSKLQSEEWLDIANHTTITFVIKSVKSAKRVKKKAGASLLNVVGEFTIKGVTKEVAVMIEATHLPGRLGDRTHGRQKGDLLVLRSTFTLKRSDFGLGPNIPTVADEMEIRVAIAGGGAPATKEK